MDVGSIMEQKSTSLDIPDPRSAKRYLIIIVTAVLIFASAIVFIGFFRPADMTSRDHFGQIDLNGDHRWYLDHTGVATREMQDRDILYHGIGASIANLKKADIVILGDSAVEFGIENTQIEAFEQKNRVRIFNLATPGMASGAYVRQIIKKWNIKPKIWIINANDYPADFFNPVMDDFLVPGRNSVFKITTASYITSYLNVASRNLLWRIESLVAEYGPNWLTTPPHPLMKNYPKTWRNVENGNFDVAYVDSYLSADKAAQKQREGACPVSSEIVKEAGRYIADIGGSVILTLLPYDDWCPNRIAELAKNLGVESFVPPSAKYQPLDGSHMNGVGAYANTRFMLEALEKTYAFKRMIGDANPGTPPPPPAARLSIPINLCIPNSESTRLFVSLRSEQGVSDHALEVGTMLSVSGLTDGEVCSSVDPFGHDQCPNARFQSEVRCKDH